MRLKAFCFFCASMMFAVVAVCWNDDIVQPIPFNHNIHTVKNELPCETCHQYVYEKAFAGMPRVDVCMTCHEDNITTNPAAASYIEKIRSYANNKAQIPWVRLYVLPGHVYYSHRRHTKIAGLDCKVCHGDIGQSTTPPSQPIAATLDMNRCIKCHIQTKAEYECVRCHR